MKKLKFKLKTFSKRQQFAISTLILTLGLLATQLPTEQLRYPLLIVLTLTSFIFSFFCLREDLSKHEWLTLLTLPTLFTFAVSSFYFLFPVRWITRIPMALFFAIGYYAILLTENIFNVAGERTIQLIRAAQTVGFYLTIVTSFLLFYVVMSLHLPFFANAALYFVINVFLFVQYFWSVELTESISKRVWTFTLTLSLLITELGVVLSFWPVKTLSGALIMTAIVYSFLGVAGYFLQEKLQRRVAMEFIFVPIVIFLLAVLTTSWTS